MDIIGDTADTDSLINKYNFGYDVKMNSNGDKVICSSLDGDIDGSGYCMYYNISYLGSIKKSVVNAYKNKKLYTQHVPFMVGLIKKIKNNQYVGNSNMKLLERYLKNKNK